MSSTITWPPEETVKCPDCGIPMTLYLGAESYGDGSNDVWVLPNQICDECGHDFSDDNYDILQIVG